MITTDPNIPNIRTIAVLVELENGHAHQVLAPKYQKEIGLRMMTDDNGILKLSDRIEPVKFEPKKEEKA